MTQRDRVVLSLRGVDSFGHGMLTEKLKQAIPQTVDERDPESARQTTIDEVGVALSAVQTLLAVAALWLAAKSSKKADRAASQHDISVKVVNILLDADPELPKAEMTALLDEATSQHESITLSFDGYILTVRPLVDDGGYLIEGKPGKE